MNADEEKSALLTGGALSVPLEMIQFAMSRSSGPGGQNVNKVNTRVELRLLVSAIRGGSPPMFQRLRMLAGKKITAGGELRIVSQETRSQEANREIVVAMLRQLLEDASKIPRKRHATRPTRGSQRRRVEAKKRRSDIKALRHSRDE